MQHKICDYRTFFLVKIVSDFDTTEADSENMEVDNDMDEAHRGVMSVRQQGNDVSRTHNTLPALSAARPLPNNNQPSGNSGINKSAAQKMRDFKSELWCLLPIASPSGTVAHFYKIDWNLSGPLVWTGHFCIILILIRNELN